MLSDVYSSLLRTLNSLPGPRSLKGGSSWGKKKPKQHSQRGSIVWGISRGGTVNWGVCVVVGGGLSSF